MAVAEDGKYGIERISRGGFCVGTEARLFGKIEECLSAMLL